MNRIRQLREQRGWSQTKLGDLLKVRPAAVSKYETEIISISDTILRHLSKIFDVSIDYLLFLTDYPRYPEDDTADNVIDSTIQEVAVPEHESNYKTLPVTKNEKEMLLLFRSIQDHREEIKFIAKMELVLTLGDTLNLITSIQDQSEVIKRFVK